MKEKRMLYDDQINSALFWGYITGMIVGYFVGAV